MDQNQNRSLETVGSEENWFVVIVVVKFLF